MRKIRRSITIEQTAIVVVLMFVPRSCSLLQSLPTVRVNALWNANSIGILPLSSSAAATSTTTAPVKPITPLSVGQRVVGSCRGSSFGIQRTNRLRGGGSELGLGGSGEQEDAINGSSSSEKEGQTGWNHNPPSPNSEFWARTAPSSQDQLSGAAKRDSPELRTGWLHKKRSVSTQPPSSPSSPSSPSQNNQQDDPKKGALYQARQMLRLEKIKQKRNHRIISPPAFHAVGDKRRVVVTEHLIDVPLDHTTSNTVIDDLDPQEPRITVYFSLVDLVSTPDQEAFYHSLQYLGDAESAVIDRQTARATKNKRNRQMQHRADRYREYTNAQHNNYLADSCLYLQGGPGFGAPRPVADIGLADNASWIGSAFANGFKRIVLMDQRGTGRSTTITKQTLQKRFPDLFILDDVNTYLLDTATSTQTPPCSTPKDIETDIQTCIADHPEHGHKFANALAEATEYMSHFRADSIVRDAEAIKDALLPIPEDDDEEGTADGEEIKPNTIPWGAALGQSYGGFCLMTYLSLIPNPPKLCLFTGGIAPMLTPLPQLYPRLRKRVDARTQLYYERHPGDAALVRRIVNHLRSEQNAKGVRLPSGGTLTARRFLQLGLSLGGSPSSFASLHSLLSSAFVEEEGDDDGEEEEFSRSFLKEMDSRQSFDDHPIYFLMHESIYADGPGVGDGTEEGVSSSSSTDWAAHAAYDRDSGGSIATLDTNTENDGGPIPFYGEAVFPWMADGDYAELSGRGMRSLAHRLATKSDWGKLYDAEKMRLALAPASFSSLDGTVGGIKSAAAAAVYYDDAYVDFDESMRVLERGGALESCKVWVTNEYQHSGLRDDGATIFGKLLGMAKGTVGTPS